jgi:FkbM family methyltransferase
MAGYVHEIQYGRVKIKQKGGLGFLKRSDKRSSPEEAFLTSLDLKGKTVYDIGGYVGLLTVVFAKAVGPAGKVVVFEPNEENCSRIQDNVRLNQVKNVNLLKLGIGDRKQEKQSLIVRRNSSATGSMDDEIQTQIIREGSFRRLHINVDTLDGAIDAHGLPSPDFIKIDIEGMEYRALQGMPRTIKNYSPQFYIEIHGADTLSKLENIRRVAEFFQSCGYSMWHVETQLDITAGNCAAAKEGHIFCKPSASM